METIDLVSRVPDQGEALGANNQSEEEEVFEDFRQNQSVNLPSPTVDRRGVVVFENQDCSVSRVMFGKWLYLSLLVIYLLNPWLENG